MILSGGIACAVIVANEIFVRWWVGATLFVSVGFTALLLAAMILRHFNHTVVYTIFCFGYERRISVTTLADGVVTVAASIILTMRFGIVGLPIASILGAPASDIASILSSVEDKLAA